MIFKSVFNNLDSKTGTAIQNPRDGVNKNLSPKEDAIKTKRFEVINIEVK